MREPTTVVSLEGDLDFANRQRFPGKLLEAIGAERPRLLVDLLRRVTRLSLAFEVLPDLATGLESF